MKSKAGYKKRLPKAWIISVDMGYGHQRTAFSLKGLAQGGKVIIINNYKGIPDKDKKTWDNIRESYELISKFKKVPLIGEFVFYVFNQFQKIPKFYPKRDLSDPTIQLRQTYSLIKRGWGKHLIDKLSENPLPMINTFFTSAFMAESFNYPGEIYCTICDADISRAWAPLEPHKSRIKYLASTSRSAERLKLYGVKPENIFLTGYPLPLDNVGEEDFKIAKKDLSFRLLNLDPKREYSKRYGAIIKKYLGRLPKKSDHRLTIMFAVGGAGAQKEIGAEIVQKLAKRIKRNEIKIILVAGTKKEVKEYFEEVKNQNGLEDSWSVEIVFDSNIENYFKKFNKALRTADILWTKPSEISFYTALGLPIILAPTIGSQEELNEEWLLNLGSAMIQKDPALVDQWLFDLIDSGWFAEAAMQGFVEGEKLGVLNISNLIK